MTSAVPAPPDQVPADLDLRARVQLSHALLAHLLDDAGLRALHIKGYAAQPGVYRKGRLSTDVDLLMRPEDAPRACATLAEHGWDRVTGFSEGSIFQHAATLRHPHLGYVDVHRIFPGLGDDPAAVFLHLWDRRTARVIAGRPVPVPDLTHQRLLLVVHAARDSARGPADVLHLRSTLATEEWAELRDESRRIGACDAWGVATGEDLDGAHTAQARVFSALLAGETGMALMATRWAAASSRRERVALLTRGLRVNRPHLKMRLGRVPTHGDLMREHLAHLRDLASWVRRQAARRER